MKRIFIFTVLLMLGSFTFFYFWASQSSVPKEEYFTKVTYHSNYEKQSKDTFSITTFNIGYLSGMTNNLPIKRSKKFFADNLIKAKDVLVKMDADVIGFQEIDFGASRSMYCNQLDSIAIALDYPVAYKSINWDKKYVPFPYWPVSMHFGQMISGQAILSRYPLEPVETIVLEKPLNASFVYNRFYLDRLIQVARVTLGNEEVILMNLHLEAFDEETRVLQAHKVRALFEQYAEVGPVLLIGDFNSETPVQSPADAMSVILQSPLVASAIDLIEYQLRPEVYNTFDTQHPNKMIDYVLFNKNYINKIDARVVNESREISDHLPVIMKFSFSH